MIKFMPVKEFNAKEIVQKEELFVYFPNYGVAFYHVDNEKELIEKYDFVSDYLEEYPHSMTTEEFIEIQMANVDVSLTQTLGLDKDAVIDLACDLVDEIMWETIKRGEEAFEGYLNACMSDIASIQINEIVQKLNSYKGLKVNEDMIDLDHKPKQTLEIQ